MTAEEDLSKTGELQLQSQVGTLAHICVVTASSHY